MMANVWNDRRLFNNENSNQITKSAKQVFAPRTQSVKKLAFGEIKNVIHNQQLPGGATPFRGVTQMAQKIDGIPSNFAPSASLCKDVLRKQQAKLNFLDAQQKLESLQLKKCDQNDTCYELDRDLRFECLDLPQKCCTGDFKKSHEEIWSEMEILEFEKILSSSQIEDDNDHCYEEKDSFMTFDDTSDEDFKIPTILSEVHPPNDSGIHDIDLPELPELPELALL